MNNFYDKKQKELNEEVKFLIGRKNEIKAESFHVYEKIEELLAELSLLKNEEDVIIKRLVFLSKSELSVYGLDISPTEPSMVARAIFYNKTKNYIDMIKNNSERIIREDDENE